MSRFFAGKPGIFILLAVFLGLVSSACGSSVRGIVDEADRLLAEKEQQQRQRELQRTAAQNALNSAKLAVDALTENSTDAQVQAAQAAVTAATNAVAAATSLSETERATLSSLLNSIRANLANVTAMRDALARRMEAQRMAASRVRNALSSAGIAVGAVMPDSSDATVQAAEDAVAAAAEALAAATSLSDVDRQGFSVLLDIIRRNLAEAKSRRQVAMNMKDREEQQRQMQQQRVAAQNAINNATMAVNALTRNSTAAQLQAANAAVAAANAAIAAATSLSETERASLSSQVNAIRANLASAIAARDHLMELMAAQKTAAQDALNAAQMAVEALNDSSTDSQVQAAANALAAAAAAIAAATSLSDAERQALRNRLAMITTMRDERVGSRQMAAQKIARTDANRVVSYSHVTFGVWPDPNRAGGNSQAPASLGHGFVQKTDNGTRTGSSMPRFGSATYRGIYIADVRAAAATGDGAISQQRGAAVMTADFASAGFEATLQHLATLTGKIEEDSFSGTTATPHARAGSNVTAPPYLPATGAYTGSFKGHFYGPGAEEAAGVFDFTSVGRKDGEFRGAFGGTRGGDPSL